MSQRVVEQIVGRLVTDERYRRLFTIDAAAALREVAQEGLELSAAEAKALIATDSKLWDAIADRVDPRLQKASLGGPSSSSR
jgi:hypothetical protein